MTYVNGNNGNGKNGGVLGKTATQAGNLLGAEIIGNGVEFLVLGNIDRFDRIFPRFAQHAQEGVKQFIVKPLLHPIEWMLQYTKKIEGETDFKQRMEQPEEVRATGLAKAGYQYGTAMLSGYSAMGVANKFFCKLTKTPDHSGKLILADIGMHLGAILFLNAPFMGKTTGQMRDALSCVFKSFGMEEEKARDMGKFGVAVVVPNYIAYASNVGILYHENLKSLARAGAHL